MGRVECHDVVDLVAAVLVLNSDPLSEAIVFGTPYFKTTSFTNAFATVKVLFSGIGRYGNEF